MISQNEAQLSFWGVAAFVALVGIFSYGLGMKTGSDQERERITKTRIADNQKLQNCNHQVAGN